jgi:hypothetical protein
VVINRVEVLGGGARIPILYEMVNSLIENEEIVFRSFHSTESLSLGASISSSFSCLSLHSRLSSSLSI